MNIIYVIALLSLFMMFHVKHPASFLFHIYVNHLNVKKKKESRTYENKEKKRMRSVKRLEIRDFLI